MEVLTFKMPIKRQVERLQLRAEGEWACQGGSYQHLVLGGRVGLKTLSLTKVM